MDFSSGSSKDLLKDYHRLAADTLLGGERSNHTSAVLSAAEEGQLSRLKSLISSSRGSLNVHSPSSGDTPLIVAAREGHKEIIKFLLMMGADVTIENDADENALDVGTEEIRRLILNSIQHEDRAISNAAALLQSAWLGDAVSVKKSLKSGKSYLDVDCRNGDGATPLLLVTRDISLFDTVKNAMESDYDPVNVMQYLISKHADVNKCDKKGRSALHLVASSENIHARKMVSLLMKSGTAVDCVDDETYSPLHVASSEGHTAIIIALVEEGGADVNFKGGTRGHTPLMLSARGGHNETAEYLISRGADVTVVDENGDTALNIAKTSSMTKLLKEAWVEQTQSNHTSSSASPSPPHSLLNTSSEEQISHSDSSGRPSINLTHPNLSSLSLNEAGSSSFLLSPELEEEEKFFLTEGKLRHEGKSGRSLISERLVADSSDYTDSGDINASKPPLPHTLQASHTPSFGVSEVEADDELEAVLDPPVVKKSKPVTKKTRQQNKKAAAEKKGIKNSRHAGNKNTPKSIYRQPSKPTGYGSSGSMSRHGSMEKNMPYNSADEILPSHMSIRGSRMMQDDNHDNKTPSGVRTNVSKTILTSRPSNLSLLKTSDPTLSRSFDCLVSDTANKDLTKSPHLPRVGRPAAHFPQLPRQRNTLDSGENRPHFPFLSDMKAVAMVSVDTERDKLHIHKYKGKKTNKHDNLKVGVASPKSARSKEAEIGGSPSNIQRSKSLMNFKKSSREGSDISFGHKKRNSTGSVSLSQQAPLLPNVVNSQFGLGIRGSLVGRVSSSDISRGHFPLGGSGKNSVVPPYSNMAAITSKLSIVSEESLGGGGGAQTVSSTQLSYSSKESTLKNSEDFDPDSLEGRDSASTATPTPNGQKQNRTQGEATTINVIPASAERRGEGPVLPPPPQTSNLVVNYADQTGSTPLSPIWNQFNYFRTESSTSTSSDFITSYIGKISPLPSVLSPDYRVNKRLGADSGHGESSDSERGSGTSSGESGGDDVGMATDSCLKWKRGRLLGKGAYGKVWEGLLHSARMIAVKEVELDTDSLERAQSQYEKIQAEVSILRSLKHRNIVSYLGTSMQMATVFIFMQYISGGSLQSIIKRFGSLDSYTVAHYTRQITNALFYIHGNDIIHRDIKGANIMVNSRGVIKLIDFGCAKNCQDMTSSMHSVRGTPYWMAPEVICGHGYGRKSDIWSLGCTVLEMATTKPPWADYPPEAAMFQIGMGKPIPQLPDHLDKTLVEFSSFCLTREQKDRPGANELLQHKFLWTPHNQVHL